MRDGDAGIEVLMMRRHAEMSFGGAWVFPGGTIDDADLEASIQSRWPTAQCMRCRERLAIANAPAASLEAAVGLHVAACREVFEETGILLVRSATGAPSEQQLERIRSRREQISAQAGAFADMLAAENLHLDFDALVYWAHWITPVGVPKRYDTRFFAVQAPPEQTAMADARESSEFAWVEPGVMAANGGASLLPPTFITLLDLAASAAQHRSAAAMLATEASRVAIPIMPKLKREGSEMVTLFPWDPEYASTQAEGVPLCCDPPAQLRRLPSRSVISR
ncbi:MAG TPA: hypothetical protein VHK24_09450 [Steroidobacter sp.]|nr:hypothetical protein [Steroidobacter sp.]